MGVWLETPECDLKITLVSHTHSLSATLWSLAVTTRSRCLWGLTLLSAREPSLISVEMLTWKRTDVHNRINNGWISFGCLLTGCWYCVWGVFVSYCHGLLGDLNSTDPLLMSLVHLCFSCCDKYAVKEVCGPPTQVLPLFCLNRPHYCLGVYTSGFIDSFLALLLILWHLSRCVQLKLHFIWLMGPLASLTRLFLESRLRPAGDARKEMRKKCKDGGNACLEVLIHPSISF